MEKTTSSPDETKKVAQEILKDLNFPAVLALYGDLGSGKTTFVQGLAEGLGLTARVLSPTFIIHRIYDLKDSRTLHHLDLYRIGDAPQIGLKELFADTKAITVIEWPEKIEDQLPNHTVRIRFQHLPGDKRTLSW